MNFDKQDAKSDHEPKLAWLGIGLLALLLIWLFYGLTSYFLLPLVLVHSNTDTQKIGQFGDVFGALNALFSAFAFAVLIFTMFLQRRELALQREELEYTRSEIRGQKEQLQAQNLTMQRQVFESSFFALLGAYQDIVRMLDVSDLRRNTIHRGRDCFKYFYDAFKNEDGTITYLGREHLSPPKAELVKRLSARQDFLDFMRSRGATDNNIVQAYVSFFLDNQSDIGHYFRTVYHIYRFIEESDLPWEEKQRFARIVRAQLSTYELLLFFYNGLSPYGYEKFWPLANKYEMFQNLDVDLLFDQSHAKYYDGALGQEAE
ncbi:MAG: hypothetical protein A3H93_05115 [Rhodocyclales bacterium RIFCSPLOWO2_02_FULL_63_24]|nr:MAG: hypothetical protein A2040_01930 [Rhodocyclales bacterium GWA2_65_19]OHC70728.1 MAG: hypothetical protein A3H93_05115 [Rhodocyclales bacterium RIFCSPLOWO2_02_FULL_63_24]